MFDSLNEYFNRPPQKLTVQKNEFADKDTQAILNSTLKILENSKEEISFSPPIMTRYDQPAFYPNTINTIQGKSGVHKSRLIEVISSCFIAGLNHTVIGFKASPTKKYRVLYVDTERNMNDQFPYAVQQIRRLGGYATTEDVENLRPISLIEIERSKRLKALQPILRKMSADEDKGHLIIVLDVITDCIENFNDPRKSMELIDLMNKMINEFDVTFICIIHENPGQGEKARGHLGTEIFNKSSTAIQIAFDSKESDLLKVKFLKCRKTKKLDPFYLVYSDEQKQLIEADLKSIEDSKVLNQVKAPMPKVKNKLLELHNCNLPKKDFYEILKKEFNCGDRIVDTRLKYLLDNEENFENEKGELFFLTKSQNGREVYYQVLRA